MLKMIPGGTFVEDTVVEGKFSHWIIQLDGMDYPFISAIETREFLENSHGKKAYILVFIDKDGGIHHQIGRDFSIAPGRLSFKKGDGRWTIDAPDGSNNPAHIQ